MKPTHAELLSAIRDCVRRQIATSKAGQRLTEIAPAEIASLERQIWGNLVQGLAETFGIDE